MSAPYDQELDAPADARGVLQAVAFAAPSEAEGLWWYQVELLPLVGCVWAVDEDAARAAAEDQAQSQAAAYIGKGSWLITPLAQ